MSAEILKKKRKGKKKKGVLIVNSVIHVLSRIMFVFSCDVKI